MCGMWILEDEVGSALFISLSRVMFVLGGEYMIMDILSLVLC